MILYDKCASKIILHLHSYCLYSQLSLWKNIISSHKMSSFRLASVIIKSGLSLTCIWKKNFFNCSTFLLPYSQNSSVGVLLMVTLLTTFDVMVMLTMGVSV